MSALIPSLRKLPVHQIISLAGDVGQLVIPREHRRPKEKLILWVSSHASVEFEDAVADAVRRVDNPRVEDEVQQGDSRRRRRAEQQRARRQARRLDAAPPVSLADGTCDPAHYLDLPTKDDIYACYEAFYKATGNDALRMAVCAVCARELGMREAGMKQVDVSDIPNRHRLVPRTAHPAHHIVEEMLLEPAGVVETMDGSLAAFVCRECRAALESSHDSPPPLSLANDLWIGPVPWELETLTLPEQMLIALLYPRVYVFKLYPRGRKAGPDGTDDTLQRGMRGTVSTYTLDHRGVAHMVEGRLMPRPPEVLSSVLSITFIGRKQPTAKNWLRSNFRVRRDAVRRALVWLKTHNPRYYGDVDIDPSRLERLPEDDVPLEIEAIVRQNEDGLIVDQESQGYVPKDDTDDAVDEDEGDGESLPVMMPGPCH